MLPKLTVLMRFKETASLAGIYLVGWLNKVLLNYLQKEKFGIIEALVFSNAMTFWQRHLAVARHIRIRDGGLSVLDVGGADALARFMDVSKFHFCALNVDRSAFTNNPLRDRLFVADGGNMPFRNESFDILTSVSTLEHMPKERREAFLNELKRVARKMVIIYVPVDQFGARYDRKYAEIHQKLLGYVEPFTAEHIRYGLPSLAELRRSFPDADICGVQNCAVWYVLILFEGVPILQLFAGLFYLAILKKFDDNPPYYGCIVSWRKAM